MKDKFIFGCYHSNTEIQMLFGVMDKKDSRLKRISR